MDLFRLISIFGALILGCQAWGAENDWYEGDSSGTDGATRDYYNRAARLSWDHFLGDWRDRDDFPQGEIPLAQSEIADDDTGKFVTWDVTRLVQDWTSGRFPNQGFFLRVISETGDCRFYSREHDNPLWRPKLELVLGGKTRSLDATSDTFLTASTYRSQGRVDQLRVSASPDHALIRFDLSPLLGNDLPTRATLQLYSNRQYATATIGIFRCRQGHDVEPSQPIEGIASQYPGDNGIDSDANVMFAANFEDATWADGWSQAEIKNVIDVVADDGNRKFAALSGKALRVRIAKHSNGALNTLWKFQREAGKEPTECYFRYYLRFGDNWNQTLEGGKLPGLSGTYGVAGWGGRRSFGNHGWSARGLFIKTIPAGNPLAGKTPIGTYCYHADMDSQYGTNWLWQIGYRGYLENNRWYCVEQYLRLNTPGQRDGILRAWVDGRPAFEKTDIRFRHNERLKIEQVWMNVYHGGKRPSPYDQHLFIDNVVIASKYIGPMVPKKTQ